MPSVVSAVSEPSTAIFDPQCEICPRLAAHLQGLRSEYPGYHARPVAPFGADEARLLIVGLAPGMHGANATGRPFTGDFAGILLYQTLFAHKLATHAESVSRDDELRLIGCRITNAVKCLPPQNKPIGSEIRACNRYLRAELNTLPTGAVILALGRIAHDAVLMALDLKRAGYRFAHAEQHVLPGERHLIDSYHCSRYNTQTRRLTPEMFDAVVAKACELARLG